MLMKRTKSCECSCRSFSERSSILSLGKRNQVTVRGRWSFGSSLPPPNCFCVFFSVFDVCFPEIRSAPEASTRGRDPRSFLLFYTQLGGEFFCWGGGSRLRLWARSLTILYSLLWDVPQRVTA
ncbi:hypothetical protein I3842_11G067800 [Carya illinoinensis]|uniref:Uncharacterized protein n=1 Tax=Carya illinoinensis TaxID=32201 RepID=A0A922DNA5_CARIL|nr:hypothetical protein I3842_11G067800 [Carya illinoinensis]